MTGGATLSAHEPLLVNTIGHTLGALVFAIFLGLVWRHAKLPAAAAALALVWNLASLTVLALQDANAAGVEFFVSLATSALCLLPAVLLHLSLPGEARWTIRAGYAVSGTAILLHSAEQMIPQFDVHRDALIFTTAGFVLVTAVSIWAGRRGPRPFSSRLLAAMAIFLFAMTFVHYGAGEAHGAWTLELIVHHAGVPLALIVLLQDYRFVLVDVFARVLASLSLAAVFLWAGVKAAAALGLSWQAPATPFRQGLVLAAGCLLLFAYGALRGQLQRALTRVAFGRPAIEGTVEALHRLCSECRDEREYLERAAEAIAGFMSAAVAPLSEGTLEKLRRRQWLYPATAAEADVHQPGVEAILPLRLGEGDLKLIALGARRGGRRYLSEDLGTLARFASVVIEHVEHFRADEMRRLVAQAELRALEAQIHPHFLFNALNTLYGVIPREAPEARRIVLNLADILRYFLQGSKTYIPLEEELAIVRSYLEIEKLRLGARLSFAIEATPEALRMPIPLLSVQPLVENAVKHGIAPLARGGRLTLEAKIEGAGLRIRVADTGQGFGAAQSTGSGAGVGLANVERRLKLCYGSDARLHVESSAEGSVVEFLAPAEVAV